MKSLTVEFWLDTLFRREMLDKVNKEMLDKVNKEEPTD